MDFRFSKNYYYYHYPDENNSIKVFFIVRDGYRVYNYLDNLIYRYIYKVNSTNVNYKRYDTILPHVDMLITGNALSGVKVTVMILLLWYNDATIMTNSHRGL